MSFSADRMPTVRRLSFWMALLSFVTLVLSAYIRLRAAGLGCSDWPVCYGQWLLVDVHPALDGVRVAHRAVATLTLLLGLRLAWCCWRPQAVQPFAGQSAAVVVVMVLLTVVGIFSADPHRVWASFINMLGGVALVALSWRMFSAAASPATVFRLSSYSRADLSVAALLYRTVRAGRIFLVATIALGALIGARYAAVACTTVPSCGGVWWPTPGDWTILNPFMIVAGPMLAGDPAGIALHLLHRGAAVATLVLLGLAGVNALLIKTHRKEGAVLLGLLGTESALGSLTVVSGFSLWLALAHSVCAAVLLAVAAQLSARQRV